MQLNPENNKRSSRPGRYRHQLVTDTFFIVYAERFSAFFGHLQKLCSEKQLSEPDFVTLALVSMLSARGRGAFQTCGKAASPSIHSAPSTPNLLDIKPMSFSPHSLVATLQDFQLPTEALHFVLLKNNQDPRLIENFDSFLQRIRFRGIPDSARKALISWRMGHYPLKLYFDIPSAEEVFEMQKRGFRCVSLLLQLSELLKVHGGRDALSFLVHDLIHAHEFYSNPTRAQQQIGFYQWISEIHQQEALQKRLASSADFYKAWTYLLADMNSYCGHLLKTTHALLQIHFSGTNEESKSQFASFWNELLKKTSLSQVEVELFDRINHNSWSDADFYVLEETFQNWPSRKGFSS